ncbi:hypothetical protein TrVE_jg3140 [Triparma verrucosa]|uniref:Fibronectin type-III domain-containing protein n=1 Tax=Triparma verrucosa TaxID=1606542 RepID=A0A9W7BM91_9STRA|nr:hypothetical protein TrVE_jg3140 [Triparma verrucosa]
MHTMPPLRFSRFAFASAALFLSCIVRGVESSSSLSDTYGGKSFDSMFAEDKQAIAQAYNECQEIVINDESVQPNLTALCKRITYIHELQGMFEEYKNTKDEKDEDDDPDSLDLVVRKDKVFEFSNFFMEFEVKSRSVKVEGMEGADDFEELSECVKSHSSPPSPSSPSASSSDAAAQKKIQDAEADFKDIEKEIEELDEEAENYESELSTLNEDKESAAEELKALKAQLAVTGATSAPASNANADSSVVTKCNQILEKATVPKYIYSSYLQRVPSDVEHVLLEQELGAFIPDGRARESCPFGASAFFRTRGAEVGVRVFTKMEASQGLKPEIVFKSDSSYEYGFSASASPFDVASKNSWGYKAGNLAPTDGLFVPSGHAVAFEKSEGAVVVRYCYVSASNLNSVKERLRVASHVATQSSYLLDTIESPGFDSKMERLAVDVKWEKFTVWPRVVEEKSDEGGREGETEKERRRKERRNKKKKNFGSWQAANAFDHKVMELTLPTLKPPHLVEVHRRNATITWQTAFEKREGDSGEISFEVEWEGRAADGETKLEGIETFSLSALDPNIITSGSSPHVIRSFTESVAPLLPSSLYHFTVRLCYGSGEDKVCSIRSGRSGLAKTSPESAPMAISSNVVAIPPKEWNEKLGRGEPYLPPHGTDATLIILSLAPPEDDGGMPVESFDVLVSHADDHGRFDGDWVLADEVDVIRNEEDWVVLGVHHLTPGSGYSFRVAAVNAVGKGAWSKDSPVARTNKGHAEESDQDSHGHVPDFGHLLHGRGSGTRSITNNHNLLIVDDVTNEVTRVGGNTVEAWAAHWSPKGFKSSGEFVEVQEGEKGEVINKEEVDGRVAVIKRGGNPLVRKVLACQRAGAVAVIILEESDRCSEYDQYCVYGASKQLGEGWGQVDLKRPWSSVRIPSVLIGQHGWAELMQSSAKGEEL